MSDGVSVMLCQIFGSQETAEAIRRAIGRRIEGARLNDDVLLLTFEGGARLALRDDGQSCCESRYMTCDDDLAAFAGAHLLGVELRDAPNPPPSVDEDGYSDPEHEVQFLVVRTSLGEFTAETHVEHNGYYGGFCIHADWMDA